MLFSTTNFGKTFVSEMTAKKGISILFGEHLEIVVLTNYQRKLSKQWFGYD